MVQKRKRKFGRKTKTMKLLKNNRDDEKLKKNKYNVKKRSQLNEEIKF